jgi:hypothetical protein
MHLGCNGCKYERTSSTLRSSHSPFGGLIEEHHDAEISTQRIGVSALGLGCRGMSFGFRPVSDRQEMIALIRARYSERSQYKIDH